MKYLKFSHLESSLIDDDIVNSFLNLVKTDTRVRSIEYVGLSDNAKHMFKLDADFDGLQGAFSLGRIAGHLHESDSEREIRLEESAANLKHQKSKAEASCANKIRNFVSIAKEHGSNFYALTSYYHTLFSSSRSKFNTKRWLSAERTFSDFNELSYKKAESFVDFKFFLDNLSEIESAFNKKEV